MSNEFDSMNTRRQKRKKVKKRRVFLVWIFALMLVVTGIIAVAAYFHTNVYQDNEEFISYASKQFKSNDTFKTEGKRETFYEYGSPISYAADYDIVDNEAVESFRQEKIKEIEQNYVKTKTAEEKERAAKNKDNKKYKAPQEALIINSATYESSNGAVSIAVKSTSNQEKDKDMVTEASSIDTYLLSEKTGIQLVPEQLFTTDYRTMCSTYFTKYFKEKYGKDELSEKWEDYVSDTYTNFNKFVVDSKTVTFFFDEGTVLNKEKGIVALTMTKNEMGDTVRESVLERYIDPKRPMVAITYDDGPGGKSETRILDCLEKYDSVATFFYLGSRVSSGPDQIKRAQNIGCELGNHTWSHPQLTKLSTDKVKEQISKTNEAIKKASGVYPTVFRPSYGDINDAVNSAVGMPVIMWSIDTLDWKTRDAKKTFESVKKAASASRLDGKIILMHSIHEPTAEATELIVPWLREKGYQTVTVSELIKYKQGELPKNGQVYR